MGNNRWKIDQLHLTTHFSISWTATLILTTKKTKHFLFKNASKNAPKMPQKCNFYFKRLLKCSKIDSKRRHDSKNTSKCFKTRLYFQYALNKGQTITIKRFILSLKEQSPISQLTQQNFE